MDDAMAAVLTPAETGIRYIVTIDYGPKRSAAWWSREHMLWGAGFHTDANGKVVKSPWAGILTYG